MSNASDHSGLLWLAGGLGVLLMATARGNKSAPPPGPWPGWVWPVPIWNGRSPVISDGWHVEKPRNHPGADIDFRRTKADPTGLPYSTKLFSSQKPPPPILAAGPGKVWSVGLTPRGHQVTIDHGKWKGGTVTWYQHLSEVWVKKGDVVKAGNAIGLMGGDPLPKANPFIHLHFELWFPKKGIHPSLWKVDPEPYLKFWEKVAV